MHPFIPRPLVTTLCAAGLLGLAAQVQASGFQLWEQDGASVGNYHAGYAAEANDASIAFYNPAGITRFKNQQVVLSTDAILTDFKYKGSIGLVEGQDPFVFTANYNSVTAQGGTFNFVPALHYVAPLSERIGFGFSVDAPFGLKTNYGSSTPVRYVTTYASLTVVDISPSLGIQLSNKSSLGFGLDIQRAFAEFDSIGTLIAIPGSDSDSRNTANDTGYGYHAGVLYEFSPQSRAGLSYHSQVVHHLTGYSKFNGPIADFLENGPVSSRVRSNITLPPYTALSLYQRVHPRWAIMSSAIFTQWNIFKSLTLSGVSGAVDAPYPDIIAFSNEIQVTIPEHFRNTWNLTIGANFDATDKIMLRGGIGYDQSPVLAQYRNVELPDNDRYVIAFGSRFKATKTLAFDLAWSHFFFNQSGITGVSPPPQVAGGQTVTTNGSVNGGADVFAAQVTWDLV
jgi:long-chain fatty acid transport protein